MTRNPRLSPTLWTALVGLACGATPATAQFDEIAVPAEMDVLDFMIGEWLVEGTFRNPDHVGTDRTLWYTTRGGGIMRFDGRSWTAFTPGESHSADSILSGVAERAAPYTFSNTMSARRIQDGFLLIVDEGRTAGTTLIYYDTSSSEWIATAYHAPTNGVSTSRAPLADGVPVFEGRATDRRGERILRRRYEAHGADHFTVRTDISFDEGVTWIDDQIVQEVRRR